MSQNLFGSLGTNDLPQGELKESEPKTPENQKKRTNQGRVDVCREAAGRGGRTVTVVSGFQDISRPELEKLVRDLQYACAAGGTLKKGRIEIQGDHCDVVMKLLDKNGFRPVRTGG